MESVVYALWYVLHAHADTFQIYNIALKTFSMRMKLRGLRRAGDNRN